MLWESCTSRQNEHNPRQLKPQPKLIGYHSKFMKDSFTC